jgi:selenocysteine lyase/cysteine desulfurase
VAPTRRSVFKAIALAGAAPFAPFVGDSAASPDAKLSAYAPGGSALDAARDRSFWRRVAAQYDVDRSVLNLENAYWGVMARPVEAAYIERTKLVNRLNVVYVRDADSTRRYTKELGDARQRLASSLGCVSDELAFTRSGTEALQNLIVNYNKLTAKEAVLYADLDFDAMQFAMEALAERRGARVVRFEIPEPATRSNLLACYDRVLRATPEAKLLLLTHLSHRTGLIMPVADIAQMARARGVDVVVDAAQSWGQLDFRVTDVQADFVGFSLHKWIGAPLGSGCMYVKADRLQDIDAHLHNRDWPAADIRARVLTGTSNFASLLTVPDALTFHEQVGPQRKEARLRYLRDYWVARVKDLKNLDVLTPDDPALHAGVTSFRMRGARQPAELQKVLLENYRILTVARKGIAGGDAVRVTPALYTSERDLDRFVHALHELSR